MASPPGRHWPILYKNVCSLLILSLFLPGWVLPEIEVYVGDPDWGSSGRSFLLAFLQNWSGEDQLSPKIIVSTLSEEPVLVKITCPLMRKICPEQQINVTYDSPQTVSVPPQLRMEPGTTIQPCSVLVTASANVTVYGVNSERWSTDSYLTLPLDALGTHYYAMSVPNEDDSPYPSQFSITATKNNTLVYIRLLPQAEKVSVHYRGMIFGPGDILSLILQEYQVFQVQGLHDLSGTEISTTAPVAVLSGSAMASVDGNSHDHMVEMLPSIDHWGTCYLVVPLAENKNGDLIKYIASKPNTTVIIKSSKNLLGKERNITHPGFPHGLHVAGDDAAIISASEPIMVGLFSQSYNRRGVNSDPSFILVQAIDQFQAAYSFDPPVGGTGLDYRNYVTIMAGTDSIENVTIDGVTIGEMELQSHVIADSVYSFTHFAISPDAHYIYHPDPSVKFGAWFYGHAKYESYANPGGLTLHNTTDIDILSCGLYEVFAPLHMINVTNITLPGNSSFPADFISIHPIATKVIAIASTVVIVGVVLVAKIAACIKMMKNMYFM